MAADIDQKTISALIELMAGDFDLLIDTYIKDSRRRLVLLQQAFVGTDGEALRRAAHSFKGSCGNMGVNTLAGLCKQLEYCGREENWAPVEDLLLQVNNEYLLVEIELKEYLLNSQTG